MAVVIDFTKDSKNIITDLINGSQTPVGTLESVDTIFGVASVNTNSPETNGNTKLTVEGVISNGYKGTTEVTYNRIALSVVQASAQTGFEKGTALKASDLLPQINARFGINLTVAEIVDVDLPETTGDPEPFTLAVIPGHLVYTGSLVLTVSPDATEITDVIITTVLDGLTWNTNGQA